MKYLLILLLTISINANALDFCELICGECPVCKPTECPSCPDRPECPEIPTNPEKPPVEHPVTPDDLFLPDNCKNPPKHISAGDGFKCMASNTRGGTIVCLLPYQFTWKPWKDWTDHHGVTMKCNANDEHFDKVELKIKGMGKIELDWDKCQNWVATAEGKIGRQHFRHKSIKWDDVKNKAQRLIMSKNGKKTCLKF